MGGSMNALVGVTHHICRMFVPFTERRGEAAKCSLLLDLSIDSCILFLSRQSSSDKHNHFPRPLFAHSTIYCRDL